MPRIGQCKRRIIIGFDPWPMRMPTRLKRRIMGPNFDGVDKVNIVLVAGVEAFAKDAQREGVGRRAERIADVFR